MHVLHNIPPFATPGLVALLLSIYTAAAIFSGLSGFGFSAIGCLSLIVLPPQLGVALLMGLSLITQLSSLRSLWRELRQHVGPWNRRDGVVPYLAGGMAAMPLGLMILASFGARGLTAALGVMLIGYSAWSLFKPAALRLEIRSPSLRRSFLVGAAGGLVGGFSAFPGSALVIWNGLTGAGKEQGRALTQPFILCMQLVGLVLLLSTKPHLFGNAFWFIFLIALPASMLGNLLGVAIYRRTGDVGYRSITLVALGISGVGLILKVFLV